MKPGIKFLNSLFEVTHLEFQTYDLADQKLIFSSGTACQLLGYSVDEYHKLSSHFYKEIIHPDDYPKVLQTIEQINRSKKGDVIEMTLRLRKCDGDYIWVYSRQMVYEKNVRQNTFNIIREVEDVTRLVEIKTELHQKVEQLKEVSYKNSHLLRSPVASIIGLISLVEDHGINGEHNRQILKYLKETITALDDIIRDINDTAWPEVFPQPSAKGEGV